MENSGLMSENVRKFWKISERQAVGNITKLIRYEDKPLKHVPFFIS